MPIYCYRDEKGNLYEREMTVAEKEQIENPDGWIIDPDSGVTLYRDWVAEHKKTSHFPGAYPLYSESLGVQPDQIKEQMEYDREIGAPMTHFDERGRAVFESRKHRREYARAHGFVDFDAGYSDPQ